MATYADENIMDEDVYFDRIGRIMAANKAGEDIVDMLRVPTDYNGDYFHRSTLEARLRCNESVFILGWRSPDSGDAIAHNIRLARSFVRAQSMRVDQNLDMGVCLFFTSDTTWEDFSHDLHCISQRETVAARHTISNSITVAISYKHDAQWNDGGTMKNVVTRREVFEKVQWFHNFTKRDIALWIDEGLFVNGVPEGTWYEKGILPYAVFPVLFCSEMKGDAISDVSPWLKIEAFMALRGNGLWCQNNMQNAWGTYFDSSMDVMKLLLQNVPAMKTYPATSPGQILLEALSRVLLDGSICPSDYYFRPDFESFMHWAAQRLVLCKSMPILSTLDEEDDSRVSKSIMLLAVKQALYNLVVFKLGRHVLLPWRVRTHRDIPSTACELLDKTLDPAVIAVIGAGTIGASVPSHIEPFGEQGFQCFVAVKQNFIVQFTYNTAAAVRIELVHGDKLEDIRRKYHWLDDFYRHYPPDETAEDKCHLVRDEWKGDWVLSFVRLETPPKGAMDAAGCVSIMKQCGQRYSASTSPYYELVNNDDRVIARLTEAARNLVRERHDIVDVRDAPVRHVRGRLWQQEYATSHCDRLISTAELLMLLQGVTTVDALYLSTQGLRVPLREAFRYRLFFSRVLTNDTHILQDDLLCLNGAVDQNGVIATRRAYGVTKKGPYLLTHVVSDRNELLVRFVLDGVVRYSKVLRTQAYPKCSLISILNMGQNLALVHSQPLLRDLFGGIISDGVFRISTAADGHNEGSSSSSCSTMVTIPEEFLCTIDGKKYEAILRREVTESDGVHHFSNNMMPGTPSPCSVSTGTHVFHASI